MEARVWLLFCSLLSGVFAKEPSVSLEIKTTLTNIQHGNDVLLNCTTTDIQQNFTVVFRKDGMEMNLSVSYMEHRLTTSSVLLPDGRPFSLFAQIHNFNNSTDTGYYECSAQTTSGEILASDDIFLSVLHFPDSLTCSPNGPVNATQNTPITVSCTADRGFPIATLEINTTTTNIDSWNLTESDGKLVKSLDLTLNASDNGVLYQCLITSPQYFPNTQKQCTIGPISVLPPTASSEIPNTPSTPLSTSSVIQGTSSSTASIQRYSTVTTQSPAITQRPPHSSVAVSVIVTLIITLLLIIVILFILHRRGYWRWMKDMKWIEGESEDDSAEINSTALQSQDNLVLIDDMIDPMYQELPPSAHTLPAGNIPRPEANQDSTNNENMPENIPPSVRPRMELPTTPEVQPPRERALDSVDDVTYARPVKKSKSSDDKDHTDSLRKQQLDFSHLYAKVKRKVSRKKQSRDNNNACVADVDPSASAHWTISFVETSQNETPSADFMECYIVTNDLIFQTEDEQTISPEDETPYADVTFV